MKKPDARLIAWGPIAIGALLLTSVTPSACAADPTPAAADDALYTMGLNAGQQLHDNGVTHASLKRLEQGIKDGLAGKQATGADQMRLQGFLHSAAAASSARNAVAAHEFLAHNAKATGVTTTASGLQYRIIQPGDVNSASPQATDQVTVNFRGTLLDGSEFDSSSKPGTLSTLQVNGLMQAWTEALTMMKPGAKWQLFVPPELGFGPATRRGVPGGSLLIYDLQLLSVAPDSSRRP
jgi:FKBP-type peptidyl-prolyl cis-trans isomerase